MIGNAYDVIVVGGGPAGTMAARYAAEGGASVLLLEKDRELGIPVRCAEACGRKSLERYVDPDPRWVAHQLDGVEFVAPDETFVKVQTDQVGYILNRRIFDQELGRRAALAGAQITTRAYAYGLKLRSGVVKGVKVKFPDAEREIEATIVIGADGVESRVGRWAGMRTHFALKDFESCYQMTLGGVSVDPNFVSCYLGEEVAPGGYAWVFPKGSDVANVGLGVAGSKSNGINATEVNPMVSTQKPGWSVSWIVISRMPLCWPTWREAFRLPSRSGKSTERESFWPGMRPRTPTH